MITEEIMSNQNVPPILIQDAKEFKENPKLLKQAIEQDLRGIKIKQIKSKKQYATLPRRMLSI